MGIERSVRLYRDGAAQTVQIPREFELPGEDAVMRKDGNKLIIEPKVEKKSVLELLATWGPDEFPEVPDLPAEPVERI